MAVFQFDVFLSHSSADKLAVRQIAERLAADGIRVWFDEQQIKPGDHIGVAIESGLERSRVLVLCMSARAFRSEWSQLESHAFRFRDPLNKERRFIPLRLDQAPVPGSLAQFYYIDWTSDGAYEQLKDACRPPLKHQPSPEIAAAREVKLACSAAVRAFAFNRDRSQLITGDSEGTVQLWDLASNKCIRTFEGHEDAVWCLHWSPDERYFCSGGKDGSVRIWIATSGSLEKKVFYSRGEGVTKIRWLSDNALVTSSGDGSIKLWDIRTGTAAYYQDRHVWIAALDWNARKNVILTGATDGLIQLWSTNLTRCLGELTGHSGPVTSISLTADGERAVSCGHDSTVRVWDLKSGRSLVLEGHTDKCHFAGWSPDERAVISTSSDHTGRIWNVAEGLTIATLRGHTASVREAAWDPTGQTISTADESGEVRTWNIVTLPKSDQTRTRTADNSRRQVLYTNAKVLLVGESGSGKTGLSMRLASGEWRPTDSTVGAWATHWKVPLNSDAGIEREIWLWDFGGQADQRLIHQLYMDDTALVALVFDGQKDDLFETLAQWDRDVTRAAKSNITKLLVAGRIDAGGIRISRAKLQVFADDHSFGGVYETSAKTGTGCDELRSSIIGGINWQKIPWRSSPLLFKNLKEEILRLKDEGRVLMRFNELRETLQLRLSREVAQFSDDELAAVIRLLTGPGVVWELRFGSWLLLQPERINAYAQAVINTMRSDRYERGCIFENQVLTGELSYTSSTARLPDEEERFVLLAMHQTLVERGICLREHTDQGTLLIFPSYYRRERPELSGHPAVLVTYRFSGSLEEIYATLVVRLHHTNSFQQDELWRYAADFKTLTGNKLGVKLARRTDGKGEMDVYFDRNVSMEEKIIFSKYVHEHLLQKASDVQRLRHYVCPYCGIPAGNTEIAALKLEEGKRSIPCINCDDAKKRIPLWDKMEELFASPQIKSEVRSLQKQSQLVLESESNERLLVGEVHSTVRLAGQIARERAIREHGLDMEIEFVDEDGEATGTVVYLSLTSGDLQLVERKSDGLTMFRVNTDHAEQWRSSRDPVILLNRASDGELHWIDVRNLLAATDPLTSVPQYLSFNRERFDVMAVRRWRDATLGMATKKKRPRHRRCEWCVGTGKSISNVSCQACQGRGVVESRLVRSS